MKKMSILVLTSVLFGCGGSSSNSGSINPITGKVIDGYISGGTVFWDCDLNGKLDTGEVSTTSSAGGIYTISPSPKSGCRLTALIPGSAIDEDTGKSVFTPYAMTALDSNSTIISPLTTLAVLHPTSSQSVAADEIKTKFNLTLALDTDYVAQTTSDGTNTRKFAKVTAQLLQANYSTTSGYNAVTNTTIVNGIAAIQSTIASTSLGDIINKVISLPSDLWNKILYAFYADPSLKVKVNPNSNLSSSQIEYLNALIQDIRISTYIGSGQVNWNRVDLSTLKEISVKLGQNGFTSPDTSKLDSDHYLQSQIINAKFASLSADANKFITLDRESLLAIFDVADATVKGAYGTAKMASVSPNLSGVFAYVNMTPGTQGKMIKNLSKIKKYTDFTAAGVKCGDGLSDLDVFTKSSISPSDYAKGLGGVSKIVGCLGDMVDSKGVSYVAGLFQGGSESFDDQFEGIMTLFDTLNIAIGLTPPTPYSNFVSGFIDVASAGVESYKAGQTIAKQAGEKTMILQSDLDRLQNSQLAVLDKTYYAARVRALTTNLIIREDWFATPSTTGWLSWDGTSLTKDSVIALDGGITNAKEFGGLFYYLPTPVDGDNFVFEVKGRWNQSPSWYSGHDIAYALDNRRSSGEVDSANQPKPTRFVQTNFRTNGWSDIITVVTDKGQTQEFMGTTDTNVWHTYKVESYSGTVSVYVDGVLKYTQPYTGIVGSLDTFSATALAGIVIDPASFKVSKFK